MSLISTFPDLNTKLLETNNSELTQTSQISKINNREKSFNNKREETLLTLTCSS